MNASFHIIKKYSQEHDISSEQRSYVNQLIDNLSHRDCRVQITCFERAIDILKMESDKLNEFQNGYFLKIVSKLLSVALGEKFLDSILGVLNKFSDLLYYFYKDASFA